MTSLQGSIVAVTGAANGIGRATALAFAQRGSSLALYDIDESGLEKVHAQIEETGGKAITKKVDVSSEAEVTAMVRHAIDELGGLDVLVNNAGVAVSGPADATPIEDWKWIADINMWSHVYAIRAALPHFQERGSGHLVHVSSAAGILGAPGLPAYNMTKFAVFGIAESLAVSLQGTGVKVSVVCPLWVDTDITDRGRITADPNLGVDPATMKQLGRELLRTAGIPPEKVADAIVSGVEEDRFLILPHPEVLGIAQVKWADIEGYIQRASQAMLAQGTIFGSI